MIPSLPTLYKLSTKGKPQFWEISYDGATIITKWGYIDGEVQETRDVITKGKNVGKKNETTPEQQALSEAQSQWEKKLKKGYVKSLADAHEGKRDAVIKGGIDPMLAHKFSEHSHKIKYPCYAQPKLDGHRCIAVVDMEGEVTLWSRTRKPITSMDHIITQIKNLGMKGHILDGELYNHDYKDRFEELTSFIRGTEAKPGVEAVEYHVYDMPSLDFNFAIRYPSLSQTFDEGGETPQLVLVDTVLVENEDELMMAFQNYLVDGYEGAMARNADGKYVNKRSYDLQKIKEMDEAEFEVVAVEEGRGKMAGKAIFQCKAANGLIFGAKMKGKLDDLRQYVDNPTLAIGRQLTVQHHKFTSDGVPRFPVGLRFREDV